MPLFFITPPDNDGGEEMEVFVRARSPKEAVEFVANTMHEQRAEFVEISIAALEEGERWVCRQMPNQDHHQLIPSIVGWGSWEFTYWRVAG